MVFKISLRKGRDWLAPKKIGMMKLEIVPSRVFPRILGCSAMQIRPDLTCQWSDLLDVVGSIHPGLKATQCFKKEQSNANSGICGRFPFGKLIWHFWRVQLLGLVLVFCPMPCIFPTKTGFWKNKCLLDLGLKMISALIYQYWIHISGYSPRFPQPVTVTTPSARFKFH